MFKKIFWVLLILISLASFIVFYFKDYIVASHSSEVVSDNLPAIVGTTVLTVDKKEWLSSMVSRLAKKGVVVMQINMGDFSDVTFRLKYGEIRANMKTDADSVWNSYISAADIEPLKSALDNLDPNFEYLDLRFGNKVFYSIKSKGI